MSDEEKKNPIFFPQAFLVHEQTYADGKLKKSDLGNNGNNYMGVAKLKGSYQAETVVSKLVSTDGITVDKHLLNLENHKISAIVPEIRIYRVLEDQDRVLPFYFPVSAEYDFDEDGILNLAESSFSAGAAAIESFAYSMAGVNPYQITRKFLNADLKIKVDNMSVLFDQKPGYALLADLFTIRAGGRSSTFVGNDKSHAPGALSSGQSCRIVVTLGYSVPRDYNMFSSEEITTIEQTKQVINLYYSGHDLNIQQDGAADVSIKYTGYLESVKSDSKFDLFSNPRTKSTSSARESTSSKKFGDIKKVLSPSENKKKKSKKEIKEKEKKTQQDIRDAFKQMISNLYERGKIYRTQFDKSYYSALSDSDSEDQDAAATQPAAPKDEFGVFKSHQIHYFTFGDLLESYFKKIGDDLEDSIKESIKSKKENKSDDSDKTDQSIEKLRKAKENLKLINILLCDVKVKKTNSTSGVYSFLNIADVPISLDNFYTKVWSEIVKKKIAYYDIDSFMNFSMSLLQSSLDGFSGAPLIEDLTFKKVSYTARSLKKKINRGVINIDDTEKAASSFTRGSISDIAEYIVICQEPAKYSRSPGSGNRPQDTKKGMFHLVPNKDRGFLKNVTFSKINQPAREASLVVGNGDLYDELRLPHNATANMYGNFMFLPGSQVYVDPNTLGFGSVKNKNSAARRLGFGGYYTVESVSTQFQAGQLSTTLSLLFNAFPETDSEPSLSAAALGSLSKMTNLMGGK